MKFFVSLIVFIHYDVLSTSAVIPIGPTSTILTTTPTTSPTTTIKPMPNYHETTICNYNQNSPNNEDDENYGDAICITDNILSTVEPLLVRDTLINYNMESKLIYKKTLPQVIITKVNVLNFGRQHGFVKEVIIKNEYNSGKVNVNIDIAANKQSRLFVEIYGYMSNNV